MERPQYLHFRLLAWGPPGLRSLQRGRGAQGKLRDAVEGARPEKIKKLATQASTMNMTDYIFSFPKNRDVRPRLGSGVEVRR